jgi:hypothetical protein
MLTRKEERRCDPTDADRKEERRCDPTDADPIPQRVASSSVAHDHVLGMTEQQIMQPLCLRPFFEGHVHPRTGALDQGYDRLLLGRNRRLHRDVSLKPGGGGHTFVFRSRAAAVAKIEAVTPRAPGRSKL